MVKPTTRFWQHFGKEFAAEDQTTWTGLPWQKLFSINRINWQNLEAIIHPLVKEEVNRILDETTIPVVVIEAIKLIESSLASQCDSLWVTDAPMDIRLARLTLFREMKEDDARLRIQAQPPQEEKLKAADIVIQNNATLEDLLLQVKHTWSTVVPETFRMAIQDEDCV